MRPLLISFFALALIASAQYTPPAGGGGGAPSGPAGGDLGGTYPNPTVANVNVATTGTADNTAMSYAAQGKTNTCDPTTDYQNGQGSNFAAVGIAGCVGIASGSTNQGALGVMGSASNASTTTNGVAGYFSAVASGSGTGTGTAQRVRVWGVNPIVLDESHSDVLLTNELDFDVQGTSTKVLGLQLTGLAGNDMSTDSAGVIVGPLGTHLWPSGFQCADGATLVCMLIRTNAPGNNVPSAMLEFVGRNSGGANAAVMLNGTTAGGLHISSSAGTGTMDVSNNGAITFSGLTLSTLTPTTNGTVIYCSDCAANSSPCTASSTGAIAKRLNGAWDCR